VGEGGGAPRDEEDRNPRRRGQRDPRPARVLLRARARGEPAPGRRDTGRAVRRVPGHAARRLAPRRAHPRRRRRGQRARSTRPRRRPRSEPAHALPVSSRGRAAVLSDVSFDIVPATSADHIATARRLFKEYEASLGIELTFQGFAQEVAALPGAYAPPAGRLFLATDGGEPGGCVALRPLGRGLCEMKRLYVRPAARCARLGRRLAETVIREARTIAYARVRLDTLPSLKEAFALYQTLSLREIGPSYDNPIVGARFMELDL